MRIIKNTTQTAFLNISLGHQKATGQYLETEKMSFRPLPRKEPLAHVAWGGGHVFAFKMKHRKGTGFPNNAEITTCHVSTYHHCFK